MKRTIILFFALLLLMSRIYCQEKLDKDFTFDKNLSSFILGNIQINVMSFRLFNKSNSDLYLWFEDKKTLFGLTEEELIKKKFFQRQDDFSLYEIGMEINVERNIPGLFSSFIKKIPKEGYFTIQIIFDKEEQDIPLNYLEEFVKVISLDELIKYIPDINKMNEIIFYKNDCIPLYYDLLIK